VKATIYHNPRCSKSRETLALLEAAGVEVKIVDYLKTPPSRAELARLYAKAGIAPHDGLRKSEDGAKTLKDATDGAILDAMAADPDRAPAGRDKQRRKAWTSSGTGARNPVAALHVALAIGSVATDTDCLMAKQTFLWSFHRRRPAV
jgi:arsenate reductase (glutaredoxin)